jgi:Arm DNA-binding domain
MPRPRKDGTPARDVNKRKLTELYAQKLQRKPPACATLIWDTKQSGLALSAQPSGHLSYKAIYSYHGRARWYHLGDHKRIGLAGARKLARGIMNAVAEGRDPQAERKAQRALGTFEELAARYVEEYAKLKNKSWKQPDALVRKHLVPRWGKLKAHTITRGDVKQTIGHIKAPIVANQTLAAASAIFAWGRTTRNENTRARII